MLRRLLAFLMCSALVISINASSVESSYEFNISIDNSKFDMEQIRLNTEAYTLTADTFNKEHIEKYYDLNTPILKSFTNLLDPIMLLALTCSEWGTHINLDYFWTAVVPADLLYNAGVQPYQISLSEINSYYLIATDAETNEGSARYKGSLQINSSYFKPDTKTYKCGNTPTDYYSWIDQVEWYTHTYARYFDSAYNSNYVFKNKYELLANLSIMANTGPSYVSNETMSNSSVRYPWKSTSDSIFEYCRDISTQQAISIIREDAYDYAGKIESKKNIQLTRYDANDLVELIGLDASLYVQEQYVGSAFKDHPSQPNEKLVHPIQAIWSYLVLEYLYRGGISE